MPPHRVGFMRPFGLKTGIDFAHFGLELSMELKLCIDVFVISIPNESERKCNTQI